jgi:hypothetical protein
MPLSSELSHVAMSVPEGTLAVDGDGQGSFRFRYLLPMAIEPQFFLEHTEGAER